jgi:hypothetical protein
VRPTSSAVEVRRPQADTGEETEPDFNGWGVSATQHKPVVQVSEPASEPAERISNLAIASLVLGFIGLELGLLGCVTLLINGVTLLGASLVFWPAGMIVLVGLPLGMAAYYLRKERHGFHGTVLNGVSLLGWLLLIVATQLAIRKQVDKTERTWKEVEQAIQHSDLRRDSSPWKGK